MLKRPRHPGLLDLSSRTEWSAIDALHCSAPAAPKPPPDLIICLKSAKLVPHLLPQVETRVEVIRPDGDRYS